jgi:putative transcriptional regulator
MRDSNLLGKALESIRQGLKEAAVHARGDATGVNAYEPTAVDVATVRARLGLTQDQFAARFGFSVATLRHWERGDRRPQGAALVLLNLIEREPQAVMRALS